MTRLTWPTTYHHRQAPAVLTALLRGAIIAHRPVMLVWCAGANVWDGGEADVCGALVQPLTLDPKGDSADRGFVRVRTEANVEMDILLRDVAEAQSLAVESEAIAS